MEIVERVLSVIGEGPHNLHDPLLSNKEGQYANQVISSGHLSAGKWVDRFEREFAQFVGARYAIAVMNGTCGLHAALTCLARGQKREFRLPSLTFVATANAIKYGDNTPYFVEYYTYTDVAVDILGHPHFNIGCMLRDAAQSLGSKHHGEYVGKHGTCVFSFNQNKIITTGGGGMITTDDEALAKEVKHLITTARVNHKWETAHNAVAFNYRMSDVSAAIGVAQLENLPRILEFKRALALKYIEAFKDCPDVKVWKESSGCTSNYWLNALILDKKEQLEPALKAFHDKGINVRPLWQPIHTLPMYADCKRDDLSLTEDLYKRVICLPSSPRLGIKYA